MTDQPKRRSGAQSSTPNGRPYVALARGNYCIDLSFHSTMERDEFLAQMLDEIRQPLPLTHQCPWCQCPPKVRET